MHTLTYILLTNILLLVTNGDPIYQRSRHGGECSYCWSTGCIWSK